MIDPNAIRVVTFDCYGTLIDWEAGLRSALRPILVSRDASRGAPPDEEAWLEQFAALERRAEGAGSAFRPYRQVLREVMAGLDAAYGLGLPEVTLAALVESLPAWPAFPDTIASLDRLRAGGLTIGVISNIDNDLFDATCRASGLRPDWVVTAQQCRSYKPSLNNFHTAMKTHRLEAPSWVHVAQSLYHDIVPCNELGIPSIWVDRRALKTGSGATFPAYAEPTLRVTSLTELADVMQR